MSPEMVQSLVQMAAMQGLPAGAGMAGGDRDNPWEHFIKQSLAASRGQGHSTGIIIA